jgi:hypothetical protein
MHPLFHGVFSRTGLIAEKPALVVRNKRLHLSMFGQTALTVSNKNATTLKSARQRTSEGNQMP